MSAVLEVEGAAPWFNVNIEIREEQG